MMMEPEVVLFGTEKEKNIPEVKLQYKQDTKIVARKISSSQDASKIIRDLFPENTIEVQEQFIVLYLNRANVVKGYYRASIGGITGTVADPRLILSVALKTLSTGLILAHNHPSGNTKPSEADISLTRNIKEAAKFMDIVLLDHLILTKDAYYSFADEGRLNGLNDNRGKVIIQRKFRKPGAEFEEISLDTALSEMQKEGYDPIDKIKKDLLNGETLWTVSAIYKIKGGKGEKIKANTMVHNSEKETKEEVKKVKNVEHITEEVKFIKRFVGLHNKVKTKNAILSFIKTLQRSITQKLITKKSTFVSEIRYIQDYLINQYHSMKGQKKFVLDEKRLPRLVAIAGGEEVFPSITIIKRFIGMLGKDLNPEKKVSFEKYMVNFVKKKQIQRDDPYANKLNELYSIVVKHKNGELKIPQAELNGLYGIVAECNCSTNEMGRIIDTEGKSVRRCRSGNYSDAKKGACSYNRGIDNEDLGKIYKTNGKRLRKCRSGKYSDAGKGACSYHRGLSGIMTAEQVANLKFDLLPFTGTYANLIGKPEKNFSLMIHGEPGAGKSTFLIKFAKYLTSFGSVLYVASEEFGSVTLQNLVTTYLNPLPANLAFVPNLDATNVSDYDFVIFDSINDAGLKLDDFKVMKQENPDTAFILVLQHTKDGQFKGGKEWEHEAQIVGKIEQGSIEIYKNRYGNKGSWYFFDN